MFERIRSNIEAYGQHVVLVGVTANDPPDHEPFMYTIGNHEYGLPELLLIGDGGKPSLHRVVNLLGEMQRGRKAAFGHGELVDLGGRYPLRLVDVGAAAHEMYTCIVGRYYGIEDYRVCQIVLCDRSGRFPEDPECEEPYRSQTILAGA